MVKTLDEINRALTHPKMIDPNGQPYAVDWARVSRDIDEAFRDGDPTLDRGPPVPIEPDPRLSQHEDDVSRGEDIQWVNCHLLSVGAREGCPRVYQLYSVTSLDRIGLPDIVVTALFWSHGNALRTFLDLYRPHVFFIFHNGADRSGLWAENSRFCIERRGILMTVRGLPYVLTVTDQASQVGFLKEKSMDDWVVGCVYTMRSEGMGAWTREGPVNSDVSMEESVEIVKATLGVVTNYTCSISQRKQRSPLEIQIEREKRL